MKTIIVSTNSIRGLAFRPTLLLVPLLLAYFVLSPSARAVTPAPDGGYANGNTAEGAQALQNLTSGAWNTAVGSQALFSDATGGANTATGYQALYHNNGKSNTATGSRALFNNTTGRSNTATGINALLSNTSGFWNTATGASALLSNTIGSQNTATGLGALTNNTTGGYNTAVGSEALENNTFGSANVAVGPQALDINTTGSQNVAVGASALGGTTGSRNIGLGIAAGELLTTGDDNIDIGNRVAAVAGESGTIRIGTQGTQMAAFIAGISGTAVTGTSVVVNGNGQLGVAPSSARFKNEIKAMEKASEAILALKPVRFLYKKELDPNGIPQFGLVAEQVEKVDPDLVTRDRDGKPYTVRYDAVNAMLLNEFLKEHRKVEEQEATIAQLKKGVEILTARLEEQASQIHKISARLEATKSGSQIVVSNQ